MGRTRTGTGIVAMATLVGLATAVLIYHYFSGIERERQAMKKDHWQEVLLVKKAIPVHAKITDEVIRIAPIPKELLADGILIKRSEAIGRIVRRQMKPGDQIRESDLYQQGEMPSISHKIKAGMRAITLTGGPDKIMAGSILPDQHVDLTVSYSDPDHKEVRNKTILQNIRVLAINGSQMIADTSTGGAKSDVTLEVSPDDVEMVRAAENLGGFKLSLRSTGDDIVSETVGRNARDFNESRRIKAQAEKKGEDKVVLATNVVMVVKDPPAKKTTIIRGVDEKIYPR